MSIGLLQGYHIEKNETKKKKTGNGFMGRCDILVYTRSPV